MGNFLLQYDANELCFKLGKFSIILNVTKHSLEMKAKDTKDMGNLLLQEVPFTLH